MPYGERERDFQLYRRSLWLNLTLVYDRSTLFGLQSGGRTESIDVYAAAGLLGISRSELAKQAHQEALQLIVTTQNLELLVVLPSL